MVRVVTASEYQDRTESGRSHPMMCRCENELGVELDVYVKHVGFHEELVADHLTAELIANCFARDLGIPAAEPCLVQLTEEFVAGLPEEDFSQLALDEMKKEAPIAFGSVAFPTVRRWTDKSLLHKKQRAEAANLYLFDTITENSDRGLLNPNLLVSGDDFKVIDFGHCFQRCHEDTEYGELTFPWQTGGILNHYKGDLQHVLFEALKPIDDAFICSFTSMLQGVTDGQIENYIDYVPESWGQNTACMVAEFLVDARDNVTAFADRVREVLQ